MLSAILLNFSINGMRPMKTLCLIALLACFATSMSVTAGFAEAEQKDYDSIDAAPEEKE